MADPDTLAALGARLVDRQPVESSNLSSIGYSADRKVLAIMFKSGELFQYQNVPLALWTAFEAAPSKGKFFHKAVRGKFQAEKLSGHCPSCGALGIVGVTCMDCGCAEVVADPYDPKPADKDERQRI